MRVLLLVCVLVLAVVPAVAQTVTNGDCELGLNPPQQASTLNATTAVEGWSFNQGNVATMANWLIGLSTDCYAGTAAGYLSIKGDNKWGTYTTTVTGLTPGQPYMVSAYLKQAGYGFVQLSARPKGGTTVGGGQHASDVWSVETLNGNVYSSDAGEIEIEIKEYTAAGTHPIYGDWSTGLFDNVTVSAVPEPSGLMALLSGVGVLGCALRRRK